MTPSHEEIALAADPADFVGKGALEPFGTLVRDASGGIPWGLTVMPLGRAILRLPALPMVF